MKLSEIFVRPVDRNIDGVIKADDLERLGIEVDEYVLTPELEKRIGQFLDAYNDFQGGNGVPTRSESSWRTRGQGYSKRKFMSDWLLAEISFCTTLPMTRP